MLSIQTKRYGENDWRTGNARRALADGERWARMPASDRGELNQVARLDDMSGELHGQGSTATPLIPCWMLREVPKDGKLLRHIRRDLGGEQPEQVKIGDGPLPPYHWAGFVLSGDWR